MAVVTVPETAVEQPTEGQALTESGDRTFQRSFKGPYAALKALADGTSRSDTLDGRAVQGIDLARRPGDLGVLTFTLLRGSGSTSDGLPKALRAAWTCKSVRNDVSILAYCGSSARRVALELWMKETDADLADANQYHRTETETDTLNSQEQKIADKIRKGVESVIRFYPVLTCTSTWSRIPRTFLKNLCYVDTPGAPNADETDAPSNLESVISAHHWLKVQDDVSETGDGKWQRAESWMGIPKTDGATGWDADLYGPNRWTMPLGSGAAEGGT